MDTSTLDPSQQGLFTCLSCSIAFTSAEDQRVHYRSDHHRYNMKRRVANLPPVSATVFNQKVLDRRQETAIMASPRGSVCEVCNKIYTTENAYRSHINSKKHKENELKASQRIKEDPSTVGVNDEVDSGKPSEPDSEPLQKVVATSSKGIPLTVDADATEEEVAKTIDEKIAAARSRLSPKHCLFCPSISSSLEDNLSHMSSTHSFFIPDADYLVDIEGLITYLGEKIAVGNVCLYCNARSREFRTMDAVRKHMVDKSHCKIAYESERDRLELSEYYDFSSSYPDHVVKSKKKKTLPKMPVGDEIEEWEDVEDDGEEADEDVDAVPSSGEEESDSEGDDESDSYLPDNELTYGDTPYELVLPSGARIGHRSMQRYYQQSFPRSALVTRDGDEDPKSGAALVRKLLADKNSALIPRKGGFGAYGSGTEVVKARNRGEAREAGRHIREFRDQKRREDFKAKVAFISNHQKHFRDPLLQ